MIDLFNRIDAALTKAAPSAFVSRFYSDSENIVVVSEYGTRGEVCEILAQFNMRLYDIGANGENRIMLTFKFDRK